MIAWQELHIQSNLPLIILAVSLICIVIIGFLEYKKLTNRMNEITNELNQIKQNVVPDYNDVNGFVKEENIGWEENLGEEENIGDEGEGRKERKERKERKGKKEIKESSGGSKETKEDEQIFQQNMEPPGLNIMEQLSRQMMPPTDGEIIMGGMPPNMMPGGLSSMIIGGPMMPMGDFHMQGVYEEDMINPKADIEEDQISEVEEIEEIEDNLSECSLEDIPVKAESTEEAKVEEEKVEEEKVEEESETESEEESEESEESEEETEEESDEEVDGIELIQGKGKVEEIKDINRSLSIKELKDICQKMGVPASGNKETLIKRINKNKI